MMTNEDLNLNCNFMTSEAGVLVLGRDHICHIVNMHYFS